MKTRIVQMKIK